MQKVIHKKVVICFQFCYELFKSTDYCITRKGAEAVSRNPFNSVDPLFYLSSFQTPNGNPRCFQHRGFSIYWGFGYDKGGASPSLMMVIRLLR